MTRFCSLTILLLVWALMSAISYGAASIGANFTAYEGWTPPGCQVAVSQNHVVVLTNQLFQVFTKCGVKLHEKSSAAFWADAGAPGGGGDARLYFDQYDRRWFAITFCCPIAVAVSSPDDPLEPWVASHVGNGSCRPDFPSLGFNRDNLFVLGPEVVGCAGSSDVLYSIPREALLQYDFTQFAVTRWPFYTLPYPAAVPVWDPPQPGHQNAYLFSVWDFNDANEIHIHQFTGTDPLAGSEHVISVPTSPHTCVAPQPPPGLLVEAFATPHSNQTAIRDGILHFTRHKSLSGSYLGIQYGEIDLDTMSLISNTMLSDPTGQGISFYYPSLAVNPQRDVVIGCNGSGPSTFVSSYAFVGHRQADGTVLFEDHPLLLMPGEGIVGTAYHNCGLRWAEYSATVVDPVDSLRFWTFQEVAGHLSTTAKMQVTELLLDGAAPRIDSFVSRKPHQGVPLDIDMLLTENTEPRNGGITSMVVRFDMDVQPSDGSLDIGQEVVLDQGTITSLSVVGRQLTIDAAGVPDGRRLLTLSGFASAVDNAAQMQPIELFLKSRIGDSNNDDQVTDCDAARVSEDLGRPVDEANFRSDLDHDGDIDEDDLLVVGIPPDECQARVTGWRIVQEHAGSGDLALELDAAAADGFASTEPRNAEVTRLAIDFSVPVDVLDVPSIEGSDGWPVLPPFDAIESNGKRTFEYRFQGSFRDGLCYRIDVAQSFWGIDVNHPTYGKFVAGDTDCEFRVLTGDVDANGWVLYADRALIEARFGAASQENARFDLNLDGVVDPADVQIAQSRIGHFSSTCALAPYDFDRDGDVDTADLSALKACWSRASVPVASGCEPMDLDADGDSDQDDFGLFQRCVSGESVSADPHCRG